MEWFLAGAYARFGGGTAFPLPNATHKAHLIRDVLLELGCADAHAVRSNPGRVPEVLKVRFQPTSKLAQLLDSTGQS
jgi:hypothetical protein